MNHVTMILTLRTNYFTNPRLSRCYDVCKTADRPVAPFCAATQTTSISTKENPGLITTKPTPTPTPSGNCSGVTVCVDSINSCGMMYGGYVLPTYSRNLKRLVLFFISYSFLSAT